MKSENNREELINQIKLLRQDIEDRDLDRIIFVGNLIYDNLKSFFYLKRIIYSELRNYKSVNEKSELIDFDDDRTVSNDKLFSEIARLKEYFNYDLMSRRYLFAREFIRGYDDNRFLLVVYLGLLKELFFFYSYVLKENLKKVCRYVKKYRRKKSNKRKNKSIEKKRDKDNTIVNENNNNYIPGIGDTILFVATNGAGLGHLTRCISVARRIRKINPKKEIIFVTTSLALTIINREGFLAYCIPSKELIKNITSAQWNNLLRKLLDDIFNLYKITDIIFDGATPYASITASMAKHNVNKFWIKRSGEKDEEIATKREALEVHFDTVIIPGEFGVENPEQLKNKLFINPILYLDKNELWSKEEVRQYLNIPIEKKAVYIQLGAGNINDIDSDINRIISAIRKNGNAVMILGESLIGNELRIIEDDIIIVKDYPNAKYYNGFDFAVSACGYNSFHESVFLGLPTLFIPNMNTKTDDQYGRALRIQEVGAGLVIDNTLDIDDAINRLFDDEFLCDMRNNLCKIQLENGATEAARIILGLQE